MANFQVLLGGQSTTLTIPDAQLNARGGAYWSPLDNGWTAAAYDPAEIISSSLLPTAGKAEFVRMVACQQVTLTKLLLNVATAGATLTANQCLAGVYNAAGTLIGTTADRSVAWVSTGVDSATLTVVGGQTLAVNYGDVLYVGWYANGTTLPAFSRTTSTPIVTVGNFNLASPNFRWGAFSGSYTTAMPGTLPVTVAGDQPFWAGLI